MLARALYQEAGGTDSSFESTLTSDIKLVESLSSCLLQNTACPLALELGASFTGSYYSSVFRFVTEQQVGGLSHFVRKFMEALPTNGTFHYHGALDPDLTFDRERLTWSVNASGTGPVWTESNWEESIGIRVFRQENPITSIIMIVLGIFITIVASVAMHFISLYCERKFKTA